MSLKDSKHLARKKLFSIRQIFPQERLVLMFVVFLFFFSFLDPVVYCLCTTSEILFFSFFFMSYFGNCISWIFAFDGTWTNTNQKISEYKSQKVEDWITTCDWCIHDVGTIGKILVFLFPHPKVLLALSSKKNSPGFGLCSSLNQPHFTCGCIYFVAFGCYDHLVKSYSIREDWICQILGIQR